MKTKRALVLSGGGSRGALQAGAVRALFEMGYSPDLITGASIGAANGAFLAVHGFNRSGIRKLQQVWEMTVERDLLPTNLWWQFMRAFFKRTQGFSQQQIREFAIANGLDPELCFRDLSGVKFYPVASDLDAGLPVVFGTDPEESVLESVLASMALPPWIAPIERNGQYLMDGGAVSNLPIEAALQNGATEIIALDLADLSEGLNIDGKVSKHSISDFLLKLDKTVEDRHKNLELELAAARGVPVKIIELIPEKKIPLWDFRHSLELMKLGYNLAFQALDEQLLMEHPSFPQKISLKDSLAGFLEVFD